MKRRILKLIIMMVISIESQTIYEIGESKQKEIIIPPSNNDFYFKTIELQKADTIKAIENKVLLRRKFDLQDYTFYEGIIKSDYFSNLERFIPDIPIKELYKKKFYKRANDNPDNDILNIYFYKNSIYAENLAKLYYYNNGWQKINLYKKDSAPITFLSYPDSVTVYIDGINKGKTPLVLNELSPGIKIIEFKKNNYYCYEFLIEKSVDIPILKRVIMQEMPETPVGTYIDPDSYSHGSIESVRLLIETLNNYRKEYEYINQKIKNIENNYVEKYPDLEPKREFENVNTFNRRKKIYLDIRNYGLSNLNSELLSELYDIEQKSLLLTSYLEKLKRRQYNRFFNSKNLIIKTYDIYKEEFPVRVSVNENGHNFTLEGVLYIPYSNAERFKNDYNNSLIKVSYTSKVILDNYENGNILSYEYTGISILYRGAEYKVKGDIEIGNRESIPYTVLKED